MENQKYLDAIKKGVEAWNKCRKEHGNERPYLCGVDLRGAKFQGANLSLADLTGADLRRADFSRAHLGRANLKGANLKDANFAEANLRGSKITVEQLSEACLLYEARLDPEIMEQVRKDHSYLLEKPVVK